MNNVRDVQSQHPVELDAKGDIEIPLRNLGNVIDFSGTPILEDYAESSEQLESELALENVNLISGLQKAPYKRKIVSQQMFTGHMRIDLNQPMVENNFIVLKGPSKAGKNLVVKDLIKNFLSTDTEGNRRVIFITPSLKDGQNLHTNVLTKSERQKCTVLSPKASMQNSAEIYLMPRAGLVLAQKLRENMCNVLLIFDKIIEYDINEKQIFDKAKQPFSPTNIYNEIMENSGDFGPSQGVMTSIVVMDTDTFNYEYEKNMVNLKTHLESIADQVIEFEPTFRTMRNSLPKLDLLSFTGINQGYWQKPLIAHVQKELEELTKLLKESYKTNQTRKEYGIQEDPWENYLFHDSQFIIPLINHTEPLSIIGQIILFKFIQRSVGDEAFVSKISSKSS